MRKRIASKKEPFDDPMLSTLGMDRRDQEIFRLSSEVKRLTRALKTERGRRKRVEQDARTAELNRQGYRP